MFTSLTAGVINRRLILQLWMTDGVKWAVMRVMFSSACNRGSAAGGELGQASFARNIARDVSPPPPLTADFMAGLVVSFLCWGQVRRNGGRILGLVLGA